MERMKPMNLMNLTNHLDPRRSGSSGSLGFVTQVSSLTLTLDAESVPFAWMLASTKTEAGESVTSTADTSTSAAAASAAAIVSTCHRHGMDARRRRRVLRRLGEMAAHLCITSAPPLPGRSRCGAVHTSAPPLPGRSRCGVVHILRCTAIDISF